MDDLKVSLFIPVYNAFRYIPHALNESYRFLSECCSEFEIIVVDDNSHDQTGQFLQGIELAAYPAGKAVRVIRNTTGPSRRENLAVAFKTAKYDVIGFIDVDLSCGMEYLVQAIQRLQSEAADIVVGSRYIKGAKAIREPFRRVMSFFYNLTIRILFGSKILDHQCGLKVFCKEPAMRLFREMGYDHAYQRGWFWDAEFLIRAQKSKLKIIEMPVVWRYAHTSTFRFFREWKCIGTMLKLRGKLQ
jgi:glycosyltransferase involved in cell wall biosynthesis